MKQSKGKKGGAKATKKPILLIMMGFPGSGKVKGGFFFFLCFFSKCEISFSLLAVSVLVMHVVSVLVLVTILVLQMQ